MKLTFCTNGGASPCLFEGAQYFNRRHRERTFRYRLDHQAPGVGSGIEKRLLEACGNRTACLVCDQSHVLTCANPETRIHRIVSAGEQIRRGRAKNHRPNCIN